LAFIETTTLLVESPDPPPLHAESSETTTGSMSRRAGFMCNDQLAVIITQIRISMTDLTGIPYADT